jgi:hypothetical protein
MNKDDLLALLGRCAQDSALFAVAQEAARRLNASKTVRVVISEPQACEVVLRIYTRRLESKRERNAQVPGLEETVQMLTKCSGQLRGGYAETDDAQLVYFFMDAAGNLVGCVL